MGRSNKRLLKFCYLVQGKNKLLLSNNMRFYLSSDKDAGIFVYLLLQIDNEKFKNDQGYIVVSKNPGNVVNLLEN